MFCYSISENAKLPRAVVGVIWSCTRRAAAVQESTRVLGSGITGRVEAVPESVPGPPAGIAGVREQKKVLNRVCLSHAKVKPDRRIQ